MQPSWKPGATRIAVAIAAVATIASAAPTCAADTPPETGNPPEWRLHERVDDPGAGYALYKRRPADSDFDAYRLEAVIDAPPAVVAAAARANMADPGTAPPNSDKTILRNERDEVVVYTRARIPVVSDRDVVTRARESFDPQTETHRLVWRATDEEGPAPQKGVVRIERSSGSWTFTQLDDGRTRAVFEVHTDLAGSIPGWVINPLMTGSVVDVATKLRARVARDTAASPSSD